MSTSHESVRTTLRIPGTWAHPGELLERLPDDVRLTPDTLFMPDGTEIEFTPMAPDDQFAGVFRSACRRPATRDELARVGGYTVNVALSGPGGSMDAARTMLRAGAAIVKAGGAGVFIDNSALAHGGGLWTEMAEDGGPDAVSFAYVNVIGGQHEAYTVGMHVLGFPDIIMRSDDLEEEGDTIIEVLRYLCNEVKPIADGHVLCDLDGPRYRATATTGNELPADSPMFNPFGRLRLTSYRDIAEEN